VIDNLNTFIVPNIQIKTHEKKPFLPSQPSSIDIQTVSITKFTLKDCVSQIQYIDLIEEKIEIEKIELR
jgi:hypothetical protein